MRAACFTLLMLAALAPAAAFPQPPGPDSTVFAVRSPLPGQLPYLAAIKFVDDGMKYVDPQSGFFVSPRGEMCFRMAPHVAPPSFYAAYHKSWCIYPQSVGFVAPASNDLTGIDEVNVSCARPYPQCMHRIESSATLDDTPWFANSISLQTLGAFQVPAVLRDLIYQMGGNGGPFEAVRLLPQEGGF